MISISLKMERSAEEYRDRRKSEVISISLKMERSAEEYRDRRNPDGASIYPVYVQLSP